MRAWAHMTFLCAAALLRSAAPQAVSPPEISWRTLQPGVELATLPAGTMPSGKAGVLHVVRVDLERARVDAGVASKGGGVRTAGEWCRTSGFSVALNLGMYQTDNRSNVGYLRHGSHMNNPRWNSYQSAVGINPTRPSLPRVLWLDLEPSAEPDPRLADYDLVVQNLRLISTGRKNVWSRKDRRWSEAALAVDARGRLLFLFTRAPWRMKDFNDFLLRLPLDIAGAMHVEGGPEASLSIHVPGLDLDLSGSYESNFLPDDSNAAQWAIPNVLGVVREVEKPAAGRAAGPGASNPG